LGCEAPRGARCQALIESLTRATKIVKSFTSVQTKELDRMDWRHLALCRDEDPELFFPIGTTGPAATQVDEAKQVCRRCSVIDDCLAWSLETGQDAGVWGGTSEDERRALKRHGIRLQASTSA
jgi:WhiB family redox-sensing transcriptional regulator